MQQMPGRDVYLDGLLALSGAAALYVAGAHVAPPSRCMWFGSTSAAAGGSVPSARNAEMNASLAHGKMSAAVARRARQRRAQTRARALSIRALPTHVPPVGCRSPLVYYTCPCGGTVGRISRPSRSRHGYRSVVLLSRRSRHRYRAVPLQVPCVPPWGPCFVSLATNA